MSSNNKFKEVLGCKYPIVAMAMNQVSDIKLAKAVRYAGGIPSLSVFNYGIEIDLAKMEEDFIVYQQEFNDSKLLFSISLNELVLDKILNIIIKYKIEFIELILDSDGADTLLISDALSKLKANNIKVFVKCLGIKDIRTDVDGFILKGVNGAGRGYNDLTELFGIIKDKCPNAYIIVSGGIGTAEQVKYFIDNGALAVGLGTVLAASEESRISNETKLKFIESSSADITRFDQGARQNSLVFRKLDNEDFNHTAGLKIGIKNPNYGHVFVGTSIDNITTIKSVADILQELTATLEL